MIQPSTKAGHRLLWLSLAVVLWFVDQSVKYLVTQSMQLNSVLPIAPGFNWVYVLNPGAAFSFLADAGGWQRHLLSVFALVVSGVLVVLLWRGVARKLDAVAYALLLAGAMGNATDRLRIGAVVDYIDLYWRSWHWPAFNVADICVSVAALLLIAGSFRGRAETLDTGRQHVA